MLLLYMLLLYMLLLYIIYIVSFQVPKKAIQFEIRLVALNILLYETVLLKTITLFAVLLKTKDPNVFCLTAVVILYKKMCSAQIIICFINQYCW